MKAWEDFWFRPADPTLLGLIRIGTGIVVLVMLLAYSVALEEFLGEHAWYDLSMRLHEVREAPNELVPLSGSQPPPTPQNAAEERYRQFYMEQFHESPPGPYPQNDTEVEYTIKYRSEFRVDFRKYGMPMPRNEVEKHYLQEFAFRHFHKMGYPDAPAPPYPRDDQERREIFEYLDRNGKDLHRLVSKGQSVWSLWFYVTDPVGMQILHGVVMFVALLFTLGLGTRVTSALMWFLYLNYIFRSPYSLFGADTMINILLLYLMLGPSGAALSLDRCIIRWWKRKKPPVTEPAVQTNDDANKPTEPAAQASDGTDKPSEPVQPGNDAIKPTEPAAHANDQEKPTPLVGANAVVRLIQVHLCIVYLIAGLAKVAGPSWWNGTAIWGVIAHPELAPMHLDVYNSALRLLARNETIFYLALFISTYFTLVFEIGYVFLIWTRLRRLILICAVVLHGLIGVIMGLQTFTLIMLVMNAAFLTEDEVHWLLGRGERLFNIFRKQRT